MNKLYSIYDLQLQKIDNICNQTDINIVVKKIRDFANDDYDTTNISDNDLFVNWEFILFEHNQKVDYPCKISLQQIPDIKIIYPQID